MKINKWTIGLAAVGLVSLAPAVLAQTSTAAAPPTPSLLTSLSATTISGYVDTSAVWNPGTGTANVAPYAFNAGKQNGFNLDAVDIKLAHPFEAGKWSAGYVAELSYGPDAQAIDGGAYPIRQAYVDMEVPVGNGLEFKLGRFDNILGYETSDAMNNPNWTRSYGYTFEPTEHTGLLANYQFASWMSLEAGVVDDVTTLGGSGSPSVVNARPESRRGLISLLTLTAPDSWGFLKGSALYGGLDYGPGAASDMTEWYAGLTLNTPVTGLSFGASWDSISDVAISTGDLAGTMTGSGTVLPSTIDAGSFNAFAGYATYKINDKANIDGRIEYAEGSALRILEGVDNSSVVPSGAFGVPSTFVSPGALSKVIAVTGTFEYDLWANVMSRLEVRWDHNASGGGDAFGGETAGVPTKNNELLVAANIIYKF